MDWHTFLEEFQAQLPPSSGSHSFLKVLCRDEFPLEEALYLVTSNDYLGPLELLVDFFNIDLNITTVREYRSILHLAVSQGSIGVTCFCLDRGVPLELKDFEGKTPLVRATFSGYTGHVLRVLLDAGANPNVLSSRDWTLLHSATYHASCPPHYLAELIQHGASTNATDSRGRTPLHTAMLSARSDALQVVQILLQNGADVNAQSETGWTPLAMCRDEAVALILLQAGANPLIPNNQHETVLHFACQRWNAASPDVFQLMINLMYTPDNVNTPDAQGRTPLHWVCQQSTEASLRYVEALCLRGANLEAGDLAGRTPLHYAALIPAIAFGRLTLLDSERRRTYEREASEIDFAPTVTLIERLLALGADASSQDEDGQSALHYAVLTGSIEIVRCLLELGSLVNQQDSLGRTPLHLFGFRVGPTDMELWRGAATTSFLQEHGQDEERIRRTRDPQYVESVFPHCVVEGELFEDARREEVVETLRMLLQAGSPVFIADYSGNCPFFLAAAARWFDPVFMLIREAAAQGLFQDRSTQSEGVDE